MKAFRDLNIGDYIYELKDNISQLKVHKIECVRCGYNFINFDYYNNKDKKCSHSVACYKVNCSEYAYPNKHILLFACKEALKSYLTNIMLNAQNILDKQL